jgi:hypothetical protein
MAPKFKLPKTLAVAVKEGNQGISNFFTAKRKPGRPRKMTMETPEEMEQATVAALEAHRSRGRPLEQQLPSSSGQKRKDPPPTSKNVSSKAKQSRVNWSKGDNRAKLEAALIKWKEKSFEENGAAPSMIAFTDIEGIPKRTFSKYASGKLRVGASAGRKIGSSKNARRRPGRPKKTAMEAPEEMEQATVAALEAHRSRGGLRKEQQLPSSSRRKRKDSPPASKDLAPKAKQSRVNWSKGDNRAKLEAALTKWEEKSFDENGAAPSMLAFTNIEGIPVRTFRKYASGKLRVGASVGRKIGSSKNATSPLVDVIVRDDPPPTSEDAAPKVRLSRVNWSKGDNRTKLEAALIKWKKEVLDENGEALSMLAFANIEGIPKRTFSKYASGKLKVGASVGRKKAVSNDASSTLVDPIIRHDPPPTNEDVAPEVKKSRMNWSKGDNRAKLEAALTKWEEEALDMNGEARSMLVFAKREGIPERTFRRYARGKLGAHYERRRILAKDATRQAERPKKTTMEAPEEMEEATNLTLEVHRSRRRPLEQHQSPSSSGEKRKDPPPANEDVAPKTKQKRVNWSKGDNRAKLEAALTKWKEKSFDENGAAPSMLAFTDIEGIPVRTFRKYASGKLRVGASVGPSCRPHCSR